MSKSKQESERNRGAKKERAQRHSGAAVRERVAQERRQRGVRREAEHLASDFAELKVAEAQLAREAQACDISLRQPRRFLARWRDALVGRELRLFERNDEVVREVLARKGQLQAIFSAEGSLDGDELLWFALDHLKLQAPLEALAPDRTVVDEQGKSHDRRFMFPPLVMNLLSVMARYLGLRDGAKIQAGLLADERWMRLLGFSAGEVAAGVTARSVDRLGKTRDEQRCFVEADEAGPVRARPEGPRGALSSQALAQWEQDLPMAQLVALFNAVAQTLVARRFVGKKVRVVVDSTLLEVPPSFQGAGEAKRDVKVKSKARRPASRKVMMRGFKLWVLMDAASGLPLAFALDTIEKPENACMRELVAQARLNLGASGKLVSLALDRGFMDGDLLWWLGETEKIEWVVPAKSNMLVHAEALERVERVLGSHAEADESRVETARRLARRNDKVDGVEFVERDEGRGRAPLVVAEVDGLQDTDFYGPGGTDSSRMHSKQFKPTPLHATVVLSWPDRVRPDDDEDDEDSDKPLVILSSRPHAALQRYRWYDDRSLIENGVFRNSKQHFALGTSLARNAAAMQTAAVMSLVALMLDRALREHTREVLERADRRAESLGILRYRRELEYRNRGKIVIVASNCYTVMLLAEFATLAGFPGLVSLM